MLTSPASAVVFYRKMTLISVTRQRRLDMKLLTRTSAICPLLSPPHMSAGAVLEETVRLFSVPLVKPSTIITRCTGGAEVDQSGC